MLLLVGTGGVLAGPHAITGRLLDADGKPLAKRRIFFLRVDRRTSFDIETEKDGTFWLDKLEPGPWLILPVDEHLPWPERIRGSARVAWARAHPEDVVVAKAGERRHIVLQLPRLVRPRVTVLHRKKPEAKAQIALVSSDPRLSSRRRPPYLTDAKGQVILKPMRPGRYRVTVTTRGWIVGLGEVDVTGPPFQILLPTQSVKLRCAKSAAPNAYIQLSTGGVRIRGRRMLPTEVPFVPPGEIEVFLAVGALRMTSAAILGPGMPHATVTLKMPPHGRLKVHAADGQPVEIRGQLFRSRQFVRAGRPVDIMLPPGDYTVVGRNGKAIGAKLTDGDVTDVNLTAPKR